MRTLAVLLCRAATDADSGDDVPVTSDDGAATHDRELAGAARGDAVQGTAGLCLARQLLGAARVGERAESLVLRQRGARDLGAVHARESLEPPAAVNHGDGYPDADRQRRADGRRDHRVGFVVVDLEDTAHVLILPDASAQRLPSAFD